MKRWRLKKVKCGSHPVSRVIIYCFTPAVVCFSTNPAKNTTARSRPSASHTISFPLSCVLRVDFSLYHSPTSFWIAMCIFGRWMVWAVIFSVQLTRSINEVTAQMNGIHSLEQKPYNGLRLLRHILSGTLHHHSTTEFVERCRMAVHLLLMR